MTKKSVLGSRTLLTSVPPNLLEVKIYFSEKEMPEAVAIAFFDFFNIKTDASQINKIHCNWKREAFKWIARECNARPWLFNRRIH